MHLQRYVFIYIHEYIIYEQKHICMCIYEYIHIYIYVYIDMYTYMHI